jgi:hypothetical protein
MCCLQLAQQAAISRDGGLLQRLPTLPAQQRLMALAAAATTLLLAAAVAVVVKCGWDLAAAAAAAAAAGAVWSLAAALLQGVAFNAALSALAGLGCWALLLLWRAASTAPPLLKLVASALSMARPVAQRCHAGGRSAAATITQGAGLLRRRDQKALALSCVAAMFAVGCCAWGWAAPMRQLSKRELAANQVCAGCMAGRMLVAAGLVLLYGGLSLGLFPPACLLADLAAALASACWRSRAST